MSRTRKAAVVGGAALVVVAALVVAAIALWPEEADDPAQEAAAGAARGFARAVNAGEPGRADTIEPAAEVEAAYATLVSGAPGVELAVEVGEVEVDEARHDGHGTPADDLDARRRVVELDRHPPPGGRG